MQTASEARGRRSTLDLLGYAAGAAAGGVALALLWVYDLSAGARGALSAARLGEPRQAPPTGT